MTAGAGSSFLPPAPRRFDSAPGCKGKETTVSEIYTQDKVDGCIRSIVSCSKALDVNLLELREACRAVAHSCDAFMARNLKKTERESLDRNKAVSIAALDTDHIGPRNVWDEVFREIEEEKQKEKLSTR